MDKFFFDQPVKNEWRIYDNVRKIAIGQGDDCTTGCLLDYPSFKKHYYKLLAKDLSKPKALDADKKAVQSINFIRGLDCAGNTIIFFIIEKAKEITLDLSQGTVKVL